VTENCQSGFMTSRNIRFSRIYESPCKLEAFKSAMAQLYQQIVLLKRPDYQPQV